MSGIAAFVVDEEPALPSAEPPPVELLEVLVELLPVEELDSPELVSAGRVVTPGVVKPEDEVPESLHAANPRSSAARVRRFGAIAAESSAKLHGGQETTAGLGKITLSVSARLKRRR